MELLLRIAGVIVPVFLIVAVGFFYARRTRPDLSVFNRIALDVLTPVLVYTALADSTFRLQDHARLLAGADCCWSWAAAPQPGCWPVPRAPRRAP